MKKLTGLLLVLFFLLFSCSNYIVPEDSDSDYPTFTNLDDLYTWIEENMTYCIDSKQYGKEDYWAYPIETMQSKKGDCEDIAFLIGRLIKVSNLGEYDYVLESDNLSYGLHMEVYYKPTNTYLNLTYKANKPQQLFMRYYTQKDINDRMPNHR